MNINSISNKSEIIAKTIAIFEVFLSSELKLDPHFPKRAVWNKWFSDPRTWSQRVWWRFNILVKWKYLVQFVEQPHRWEKHWGNCDRIRSSYQRCSIEKGVLKTFEKFRGKHPCWRKRLQHRYFPVNFPKFVRTTFFTEHLWWLLL